MSSGPFGTATPTRHPGRRTPHDLRSSSVRYTARGARRGTEARARPRGRWRGEELLVRRSRSSGVRRGPLALATTARELGRGATAWPWRASGPPPSLARGRRGEGVGGGRRRRPERSRGPTASPATTTEVGSTDVVQVCGPADLRLCRPASSLGDVRRLAHQQGVVERVPRAPRPASRVVPGRRWRRRRGGRAPACVGESTSSVASSNRASGSSRRCAIPRNVDRRFSVPTPPRENRTAPTHSVRGRTPARAARPERSPSRPDRDPREEHARGGAPASPSAFATGLDRRREKTTSCLAPPQRVLENRERRGFCVSMGHRK